MYAENRAWVLATMVEANEMTEGEIKFEDFFGFPKIIRKTEILARQSFRSQRKQSNTGQDSKGSATRVRKRDRLSKRKWRRDYWIGKGAYGKNTAVYSGGCKGMCVGRAILGGDGAPPPPPTPPGCLCSPCPVHAIVSDHRNTMHSKHGA